MENFSVIMFNHLPTCTLSTSPSFLLLPFFTSLFPTLLLHPSTSLPFSSLYYSHPPFSSLLPPTLPFLFSTLFPSLLLLTLSFLSSPFPFLSLLLLSSPLPFPPFLFHPLPFSSLPFPSRPFYDNQP